MRKHRPARVEIPKSPVIDTNVLFDFLVWRFSVSFSLPEIASELRHLRTADQRDAVAWYLSWAKPIITSPEVIAELHGRVTRDKKLRQPRLGSFWTFAQQELRQLELDEELMKLLEMQPATLAHFGPTDTGVLGIAARDRRPVLTEDGKLRSRCLEEQIKVVSVDEILAFRQDRRG